MPQNPYQSPATLGPRHDPAAVAKAERLPFRCAFGGGSIGSAAGALSAGLLKLAALLAVFLRGGTLLRPPDYRQPLDSIWEFFALFLPELVVALIAGTLLGILVGVLIGGFLGTVALFLSAAGHRRFPWIAAPLGTLVGMLLGYMFGAFSYAPGGLPLEPIPVAGACIVGLLGMLAAMLFGRGVRRRVTQSANQQSA